MGFLNDRIVASVDLYLKNTNDMLTKKPVPQTSGTSLEQEDWPPVNIGKVRNKGIEFTLNTQQFCRSVYLGDQLEYVFQQE